MTRNLSITNRPAISIFCAFLSSRILCALFVYLGHLSRPFLQKVQGGWIGIDHWWLNPWTTYDSYWYLQIAASGYQEHTTAFFPLYPLLLRWLGETEAGMAIAGIALSNVLFMLALWLVFLLTRIEHDDRFAHATIWLLAFSPASAFFSAVYSESLFLFLLSFTFFAVRHQKWLLAALLAGATALTRNPGFLIAAALYLEVRQHGTEGILNPRFMTPGIPLAVFIAVQGWFAHWYGNLTAGIDSQVFFHRKIVWPWMPIINDLGAFLETGHAWNFYLITLTSLTVSLGIFVLIYYSWGKIRTGYLLIVGGITMMNLVYARELAPQTISEIRYMGALFPVSQMLALAFLRLSQQKYLVMLLVGLYGYLFLLMSFFFGRKILF